ncbi:hypothetical protein [Arthrobacter cryoconiti]|uniref:Uncharacterized protein n=1 Tax=Arthrobacter cryoconiti TaxID=748907 RepID=A0ABV8R7Q5_9MICC|nr:hypothetical protein [Arthrobacter cryoconiti]MCC9069318.1 hypothetical protein [Arthrobacter cryoconiti]
MSAFITSKDTVDLLTTAAMVITGGLGIPNKEAVDPAAVATADQTGQMLVNANYASVNYRYSEDEKPYEYTWQPVAELIEATVSPFVWMQVFQAAACFEYQACESPDWAESETCKFITLIRKFIDGALVDWPKVGIPHRPGKQEWRGLDECSWDWTRDQGFPQSMNA